VTITESDHSDQAVAEEHPVAPAEAEEPGAGEWQLVWVDPRGLVIGVNTRSDAALDRAFVASVRDRGVREPIIARRGEQGELVVRKGQRRTLAAVEAGLATVPVVVEPEGVSDAAARQVDRIVDQLGENQHRTGLPVADEVAAHQQLLDLGLSAGQIARRTRTRPARVRTTLAVAGSERAAAALGRYQLSLEQAAVVAEFDRDPEAVAALVAAARTSEGQFAHVAQQARDQREEAALRGELLRRLQAEGVRVVERPERYGGAGRVRALESLRCGPDAEPGSTLDPVEHRDCPGHVGWVEQSWREDAPLSIAYGCEDWTLHGHAARYAAPGQVTTDTAPNASSGGAMTEEQKAVRQQVIANNKAWTSATTVRHQWLRQFLARRTPPKDAAAWIAVMLAEGCHDLRRAMEDEHSLARDLLGLTDPDDGSDGRQRWVRGRGTPHPVAQAAATANPARATMLTLALVLAALEAGTSKNTWRGPTRDSIAYLTALAGWGYELSEVEQLALTGNQPDTDTPEPPQGDDEDPGSERPEEAGENQAA
jgi:ParB family transcriptional regulator, chromosome partitioning protein